MAHSKTRKQGNPAPQHLSESDDMNTLLYKSTIICLVFVVALLTGRSAHADTAIYDGQNRLARINFETRQYTMYAYDAAGNITSITTRPPPTLDVNGDGSANSTDTLLVLRYLLGYRGAALVAGVTLGAGRPDASSVETFLRDTLAEYDLLGRSVPAPVATIDGLILTRIMLGIPDAALLTGINLPAGTQFNSASLIRGNVNTVFGTTY